jgi:DNA-binding response OmpR family regulator
MTTPSVLLAAADDVARAFLADNLAADGYDVLAVASAVSALNHLEDPIDVAVVDVSCDCLALLDGARAATPAGPWRVLALTLGDDLARARLLDRGADDVLGVPYSYVELRARLGALLRRSGTSETVLRAGSVRLDVRTRRAWVGEVELERLPVKEYELLRTLIVEPSRVWTREELLAEIWGYQPGTRTRTVDTHAFRLRRRLQVGTERFVTNVWGVGYRLLDVGVG